MKKIFFAISILLLLPFVQGCRVACKEGHGPVHARQHDVSGFTGIRLNIAAEAVVTPGNSFRVQVEAEDNLLDEITTEVHGRVLRIGSRKCLKSNIKIRILVTLPELNELEINGTGDIVLPDTFQVDKIALEINGSGNINGRLIAAKIQSTIHGSGDIRLSGSANEHDIRIMGSGDVFAADLPCNASEIKVNGSGDVYVYAINELDAHINGTGNVHYKGKPSVSVKINGTGKVVDEN